MKRWTFLLVLAVIFARNDLRAQDWVPVLKLSNTFGSSAFFFNANEGLVGTGHYLFNTPAQIYYTTDGGATWNLSQFVNPNIRGEVTDIFFRDRMRGWATIREVTETGWSGIYHSTDGGITWNRVKQAQFPAGIRETKRGVFYTERDLNSGVMFSSDTGKTWTHIATTLNALGIDFMDDATGFVTSQATSDLCPHLLTTDSGNTWRNISTSSEAWTPYGDPKTRSFFLASEVDQLTFSTETAVLQVPVANPIETRIRTYGDSGLAGGIAGSHICTSVIYVQGREPATIAPGGIIRTTDGGKTWKMIGGPNTINDKRFAVTGRGAVVYAFDNGGTIWKTTDGGDGAFSASVLPSTTVSIPTDTIRTSLCDSATFRFIIGYHACDSIQIASVSFENDRLGELTLLSPLGKTVSSNVHDTLQFSYRPSQQETKAELIQLKIRQPDGFIEDTIVTIPLSASNPSSKLGFSGTNDTLQFPPISFCSDEYQTVTLNYAGCGALAVDSISISGKEFSLASSQRPFILTRDNKRSFLIHFIPDSIGLRTAKLYAFDSNGRDSLLLETPVYSSGKTVSIVEPDTVRAPACDSSIFLLTFRNVQCAALMVDSIHVSAPFQLLSDTKHDSLQTGDTASAEFRFVPARAGMDSGKIQLSVSYAGGNFYDTTFTIPGYGTPGSEHFSTTLDSIKIGTVPLCSLAIDTLVVKSSGCSGFSVSAALNGPKEFSIIRNPKSQLGAQDSDIVIVQFDPDTTLGERNASLIFTTSIGSDTVPISATTVSSGGSILIAKPQNVQSLTCTSAPFSFSITNHFCDSITLDNIKLTGPNASEFLLTDNAPNVLGPQDQKEFAGIFSPQDSTIRTATIRIGFHEANGTVHDTTITINAKGIAVPPIEVSLGSTVFKAGTGGSISIPIVADRGSVAPLSSFDFSLVMNTDLITPTTTSNGFFGNGSTISISRGPNQLDTVHIHFQNSADAIMPSGPLCNVICTPYVTSQTSTPIILRGVNFKDKSGSSACLISETVPDTVATFVFNSQCGDTTLSQFLRIGLLQLDHVSPNPTSGQVSLTFFVPSNFRSNGVIEVFDELGEKQSEQPIHFEAGMEGFQTIEINLSNGPAKRSGVRYLRIRTPESIITANILLLSGLGR